MPRYRHKKTGEIKVTLAGSLNDTRTGLSDEWAEESDMQVGERAGDAAPTGFDEEATDASSERAEPSPAAKRTTKDKE